MLIAVTIFAVWLGWVRELNFVRDRKAMLGELRGRAMLLMANEIQENDGIELNYYRLEAGRFTGRS